MKVINNIFFLIEKKLQLKIIYIFLLTLIGTFLEILGVGIILPVLTLILQGKAALAEMLNKVPFLIGKKVELGNYSDIDLVIYSIILIIFIFFLKTLFFIFLMWRQNKFSYEVESSLSNRVFGFYLNKDYLFHTKRNSAELFRNVKNEVGTFRHFVVMASLTFFIEILVIISIALLIIYLQPIPSIGAAVSMLFFLLIFSQITKKRLAIIGKNRQRYDALTIQHLNQGLDGIKEIKISSKEQEFLSIFDKHNLFSIKNVAEQKFWILITKHVLEFVAVLSFMLVAFFVVKKGYDLKEFLPTIGLIVVATFRLLPSTARIVQSINNIRFGMPSADLLVRELKVSDDYKKSINSNIKIPEKFNKISFNNISFSYPKSDKKIIENTSFEIFKGDQVGILGPSGSGKSTFIDILTGLLQPTSGNIKLDNLEVNLLQKNWYKQVGYVPQFIFLTDDTIKKNIAFGIDDNKINQGSMNQSINIAELNEFVNSRKNGIDTRIGEFGAMISGGQRQRIGIARAIYSNTDILVFDEATSAIDLITEEKLINSISSLANKTIIMISHRMSTLKNCTKIFELKERALKRIK
jgi:ATP-binding cassette, subfamily B, bacterial PglK